MILSNRNIIFTLLFISSGLSASATVTAPAPAVSAAPTAEQMLKEVQLEEAMEELHKIAVQQSIKLNSIVQSLNLMVVHQRVIRLNESQLQILYQAFREIQAALHSITAQLRGRTLETISTIIAVNDQLASYLVAMVKKDLKKITPFTLQPAPAINDVEQAAAIMGKTLEKTELLESMLKDLGVGPWERFKRSMRGLDDKYQISNRMSIAGFVIFAGMIIRYSTKSGTMYNPRAERDAQYDKEQAAVKRKMAAAAGGLSPAEQAKLDAIDKEADETIRQQQENKAQDDAMKQGRYASWWQWFDEKVIGNAPVVAGPYYINSGTGTLSTEKSLHARPGVIGTLDYYLGPVLRCVGFAAAVKTATDKIVTDVHAWKGMQKNPKDFVKFNELWHNEKQVVHPIEELFVTNALEHYEPRITFDDIVGLHDQKKELKPVINYLLNPELFEKTGTSVEKGYLFYGPSRTGKTYLAEALAGELVHKHGKKLAFIKIKGGDLRYVGIKKVLEVVKKYAPCIVFIDELDLLNLQRDQNTQLLEEFLTGMRTDDGKQVIFLAATNRIDHIDHALLQPGRFGKIITFENPSFADRRDFFTFELHLRNISNPSIDLDRLALETENCTYGDLSSILNHALTKAMQTRQVLAHEHFESGVDVIKRKILDAPVLIPEAEKTVIAAHLAGHALAYALLPCNEVLHKVTMQPIQKRVIEEKAWMSDLTTGKKITTFGDVFTLHRINSGGFDSYEQKLNKVKALLAGHAAEKLLIGGTAYNYHEDYEAARMELESLVFKGIKKDQLSRPMLDAKSDEVQSLIKKCEEEATAFLTQHRAALERLAAELKKATVLSAQEVLAIINAK